jgi:signal transduction histidine kinase
MLALVDSLKLRVQVLGMLVLLFLAGCAVAFALLLRNSETQVLSQSAGHLSAVASALARDYVSRAQFENSKHEFAVLENPSDRGADDVLALMTAVVLRREVGTEGGFYSAARDQLLGYSFPTHEGPGIKKDMPQKELPTILDLARKAAKTRQPQSFVFRGQRDAIIFEAAPIVVNDEVVGSAWIMKRLPGLRSERDIRAYAGFLALGVAAALCVLLAFLIARSLGAGVTAIEERLAELEQDLATPSACRAELAEIDRIRNGVDRLATTLRQKLANERELEGKLRSSERLAALGRVAAGVAHELRNPLATIRLRTQMSIRETPDVNVRRNGSIVLDEIARLDQMVERLLYFSRPLKIHRQNVKLCELLGSSVETQSQIESQARITFGSCDETLETSGDPSALRQVFDNLIRNAIEATQAAGGEVRISAQHDKDIARIEVRDTGAGVRPKDLPHIFDPFFTTKQSGTGLGLSICYEIIKAHGGDIEARSEAGHGTTVIVSLPIVDVPQSEARIGLGVQTQLP